MIQIPDPTKILNRRQFLTRLSVALATLAAVLASIPVVGFLLGPSLRRAPEAWHTVGSVDSFKIGETQQVTLSESPPVSATTEIAQSTAWLRRESETEFVAFSVSCTHLGCPVSWLPGASLFMCPCHGGVYYADGSVAGGPPPRSLKRYPLRVQNGQLQIQV